MELETIAKSYDRHFLEHGKADSLNYDNLPEYITGNAEYPMWKSQMESGAACAEAFDIREYLSPQNGMKFISLGCGVSLRYKGYDEWPSLFYGVDISSETIKMLKAYVKASGINVGSLHCGSIFETPYADNMFDIGECIGVLEYYDGQKVQNAIKEIYRILKPGGKFVLDTVNAQSASGRIAMMIEECMGRPNEFDLSMDEFEDLLNKYFIIEDSDNLRAKRGGYVHEGMVCHNALKSRKVKIYSS